jgi:hypothetical protein
VADAAGGVVRGRHLVAAAALVDMGGVSRDLRGAASGTGWHGWREAAAWVPEIGAPALEPAVRGHRAGVKFFKMKNLRSGSRLWFNKEKESNDD